MSRCGVYVYAQEKRYRRQTLPELTRLLKLSGDEILPVNDAYKPPPLFVHMGLTSSPKTPDA